MNHAQFISKNPTANPAGTDGFEFLEYTCKDKQELESLFTNLGFTQIGQHKNKQVSLWAQGDIHFIINNEANSHAANFANKHGPSASAMAFRVKDAEIAKRHLIKQGAKRCTDNPNSWVNRDIPVFYGIGDSLLYLVDRYGEKSIYDSDFEIIHHNRNQNSVGLNYLDHVTHNVYQGNLNKWAEFYLNMFNFSQTRYFDISGKLTGLRSRAMTSPCGKIRIPINESADDKSQIAEYLDRYHGEGIQHIALGSGDIYNSVETLRAKGNKFMKVPDTYFRMIDERLPNHGEDIARMQKNKILIDGELNSDAKLKLLLQIFTDTVIGPIFFEIIQRKGNDGFGEGNFQALFDSIELDQIERGVLKDG